MKIPISGNLLAANSKTKTQMFRYFIDTLLDSGVFAYVEKATVCEAYISDQSQQNSFVYMMIAAELKSKNVPKICHVPSDALHTWCGFTILEKAPTCGRDIPMKTRKTNAV